MNIYIYSYIYIYIFNYSSKHDEGLGDSFETIMLALRKQNTFTTEQKMSEKTLKTRSHEHDNCERKTSRVCFEFPKP